MEDQDRVSILLFWELEQGEHFVVVFEIADCIFDDFWARRSELGELSRMCAHPMAKFGKYAPCFGQGFTCEWCELVSVFRVAGKGEHLRGKSHKFYAVFFVPSKHLWQVSHVC